jgi:RNA polymerase sigma-70 factor (ECF subfamily)
MEIGNWKLEIGPDSIFHFPFSCLWGADELERRLNLKVNAGGECSDRRENDFTSSVSRMKADLTLETLLEQARPQVWDWLSHWVRDPDMAADLTQEVLIKAWEARRRWDRKRDLGPWLRRITVNHYVDWRRCRARDVLARALHWEESGPLGNSAAADPSPEDQVLQAELRGRVHAAVTNLPPRYREVVWFYYLEGWTCEEIASTLDLTVGQVTGRLYRGRAMLRVSLQPFLEE